MWDWVRRLFGGQAIEDTEQDSVVDYEKTAAVPRLGSDTLLSEPFSAVEAEDDGRGFDNTLLTEPIDEETVPRPSSLVATAEEMDFELQKTQTHSMVSLPPPATERMHTRRMRPSASDVAELPTGSADAPPTISDGPPLFSVDPLGNNVFGDEVTYTDDIEKPPPSRSSLELQILEGKFVLLRRLAKGGFGEVWLARRADGGGRVAIKLLRTRTMGIEPDLYRRFEREALTLARLRHPNIVQILDVGRSPEDQPFIAMELVDGHTLKTLRTSKELDVPMALSIGVQVLSALEYTHSQDPVVIHRDLKPTNILVDNNTRRVKIIDFGLVKLLGDDVSVLTRKGFSVGTLSYMSPQQLAGETIDARADLFAIGVVLYELLTGYHPFKPRGKERVTPVEYLRLVSRLPPHSMSNAQFRVPPGIEKTLRRALAKDPRDRFASAAEFRAQLERFER